MVFGLYNVELGKTQIANPYTNMGITKANVQTNMWGKYFAALNRDKQATATNPYDAMAKLNNYYNSQKVDSAVETETQDLEETQNIQAQKPVDPKIGVAKGKLGKLTKALSKCDFPKVTEKLDNSIKLLQANPELSYLAAGFKERLGAAAEKFSNLISKGMNSINNNDLDASELNQLIDKIKEEAKQLQSDWKKVVSGYVKAGACSEAMLLVNNDKNKEKYRNGAIEAVADLPNFKVDGNSTPNTQTTGEADENQNPETTQDDFTDNEISTDVFAQDTNIQIDTNITDISTNPFETDIEASDKTQTQTEVEVEEVDKELEDADTDILGNNSDSDFDTNKNEINKLKSELKEDSEKEHIQNIENKKITVDTIDGKKTLKSVLFS